MSSIKYNRAAKYRIVFEEEFRSVTEASRVPRTCNPPVPGNGSVRATPSISSGMERKGLD
jgi:hypothetical protein